MLKTVEEISLQDTDYNVKQLLIYVKQILNIISFRPAALLTRTFTERIFYANPLREFALFGLQPQIDVYLFFPHAFLKRRNERTKSQIGIRYMSKR